MRKAFLVLSVLSSSALSAYVPGTPGAAWTKEEVLAVKAGLFNFYQTGLNRLAETVLNWLVCRNWQKPKMG